MFGTKPARSEATLRAAVERRPPEEDAVKKRSEAYRFRGEVDTKRRDETCRATQAPGCNLNASDWTAAVDMIVLQDIPDCTSQTRCSM